MDYDSSYELDKNEATQQLFYDFKCMQETGTHILNVVVYQEDMGREWCFFRTEYNERVL